MLVMLGDLLTGVMAKNPATVDDALQMLNVEIYRELQKSREKVIEVKTIPLSDKDKDELSTGAEEIGPAR